MIQIKKKTHRKILVIFAVILFLFPFLWWENNGVSATDMTVWSKNLPTVFDGFRIVQVSDLHDCNYGEKQSRLLELTREAKPDIIVITGDMIENWGIDNAVNYAKGAVDIAPVYYVPGNHEAKNLISYKRLKENLEACSVQVLEDEETEISRDGQSIRLIGVRDPAFYADGKTHGGTDGLIKTLSKLIGTPEASPMNVSDSSDYTILLSHRPELMDIYEKEGIDLVFAGHTHGGLVRLPIIGAIYALNQGFFPKYTAGVNTVGETSMVVSRGLGNNWIGQRINNRPELVVATLRCGKTAEQREIRNTAA